jgi:hypothetical protein
LSHRAAGGARGRSSWESVELLLVGGAVAGTMLTGLLLAAAPLRVLDLAGLPGGSAFLVRQSGVLLMVLAVGYLLEYRRARSVALLLTAEGLTAAFLLASWLDDRRPAQLLLFLLQALLGALTWAIHRLAARRRWARVELRVVDSEAQPYRPAGGGR